MTIFGLLIVFVWLMAKVSRPGLFQPDRDFVEFKKVVREFHLAA